VLKYKGRLIGDAMHGNSLDNMAKMFDNYSIIGKSVLDYGSFDVNGTYKNIVLERRCSYVGCDIKKGRRGKNKNVDLVLENGGVPVEDESFDVVISGQCLEHVKNPFKVVDEMARCLKKGGNMILIAPFILEKHSYPIDTFRYLPDGFGSLFENSGLETLETYISYYKLENRRRLKADTIGIAKKYE
jgi:SAM-dependent methyltransferase